MGIIWVLKMKMKININVDIPKVPNFIKVNEKMESLTFFTNEQLKEISKKMYEKMLERKKQLVSEVSQ